MRIRGFVAAVACVFLTAAGSTQMRPPTAMPQIPYDVVANWSFPYQVPGYVWASVTGLFAESPNRIFAGVRGRIPIPKPQPPAFAGFYGSYSRNAISERTREMKNCLFVLDGNGKVIEDWSQWDKLFEGTGGPHKIRISPYDPERRVWVLNDNPSEIYVFSNDGKQLLQTLGERGVAKDDETHFGRPQDLTFLPDGSILVADGLTNSRIVKLDKNGKFIAKFGNGQGAEPGQMRTVHAVEVDKAGRIYISDRGNERLQVFDASGKHLAVWPNLNFMNHIIVSAATQDVWAIDNQPVKMVRFDPTGKRIEEWDMGSSVGLFSELHQMTVDSEGNLYGADNVWGRLMKFKPKAGAKNTIGPPVPLMPKK